MKRTSIIFGLLILVFAVCPYLIYFLNFRDALISNDTTIWGDFGSYINGTLMPIIALVGFILTYTMSINAKSQYENNILRQQMAQRPLIFISYTDSENLIEINIANKGIGPAIIEEYKIKNLKTKKEYPGIYQLLLQLGTKTYTNYTGNQNNLVLSPNEERNLFKLTESEYIGEKSFEKFHLEVRRLFMDLEIQVKYQDVYTNRLPIYTKKLDWFGRHF